MGLGREKIADSSLSPLGQDPVVVGDARQGLAHAPAQGVREDIAAAEDEDHVLVQISAHRAGASVPAVEDDRCEEAAAVLAGILPPPRRRWRIYITPH